ncbi:Vacuolar protein sorting-associated protein atg6 [Malassezia vespertilionis]|uniref:Atg6p n=1 Tax=Malassezia vespertilionis TaxID=2020962 RepID=A0A2N1JAC5_9BASI|nr:Vacuolar protein sorting-associated protein atg6 [Malassezia vespertilionis]PKI83508.1 Atg6p [Malassezia vespertilionis]WFD07286.1 Vacuolar protein sorting-associated protein atg6 [Malassezia vespertilionis]
MVQDMEKEIATLTTLEREMARLALVQGDLEFTAQDAARFQRKQDSMLEETHALDSEKERILHKLAKQDDDKASLDAELKALVQEGAALDAKEAQSWDQYNQMAATLQEEMDKHASCAAELTYYQTILAQLDKTSAYKDVFCIEDHGRGMATINGQRLGRIVTNPTASGMRATEQVDWPEINAALGQSAFLLAVLSRILQYKFQTYNIIPRGSFTFVEKLDKSGVVYELYGTSDWQLGRLLHSRRFDYALIGFLECVHELCTHVKQQDTSFEPPYSIRKDRIGDASIRLQFNQPENWTRACKYVLLTYVFFVALTLSLRALLQYALDHIPPAIDR